MGSVTSIDGLNSGLNTTQIIDALLTVEKGNVTLLEQRQNEKTNIISTLQALQAKLLALNTDASSLARRATFEAYTASVSDDTVLSAATSGRVSAGTYDIQVLSVARNHQLASQGFTDQSVASFGTGKITIGVGTGSTKTITIDATNNSLVGIKNAINNADAGVTASIINDGSASHPYRLVLTADKTGQANRINVSSSLSGLNNLNFTTSTFDPPETLVKDSASTAIASLGPTASYTGATNKIYTLTVAGTGKKTVGSDAITLNWTDGTNSGAIVVTQADLETALVGTGSEGLKINLSSGTMYGGDSFQVTTFAPVLQQASDARIAIGSAGGTGSPITVISATNEFKDVIGGLTLTVKKVSDPGTSVQVKADMDTAGVKDKINTFIKDYNDINDFIDKQNSYNTDTKETGVLFADYSVQIIQSSLRSAVGSRVTGLASKLNQLAAVGIRSGADGKLSIRDSALLETALKDNLDGVINLFTNSGDSSNTGIEFVSASEKTKVGKDYEVDITRAATKGRFQGGGIVSPSSSAMTLTSSNNRLKIVVDGLMSDELALSERTYSTPEQLVTELQQKINADAKIGGRGVTVSWVETTTGMGYINLDSSTYGSASKIDILQGVAKAAYSTLGLLGGSSHVGIDVEGRINGEAAIGAGQMLTGKAGNATTDGLKLKITLGANQLVSGTEGTISVSKGVAAKTYDLVASLTKGGDGMMDRRIKGYQNQITDLKTQIDDWNKRLEVRRQDLQEKFQAMESALGKYSSLGSFLSGQVNNMNSNWLWNSGSSSSNTSGGSGSAKQ
jgi:flagellar hook-associated protein 2